MGSWPRVLQAVAQACRSLPGASVMRAMEPPLSCGRHFHRLGPRWPLAAVAVLLCPQPQGGALPLVVRPGSMPQHPGQVGLPGGLVHRGESARQAALRELEEELGVSPQVVQVLGATTPLRLFSTRLELQPWLCGALEPVELTPDPREVQQVLWFPLERLLDPHQAIKAPQECLGVRVEVPGYRVEGRVVWGATALVLAEVAELLRRALKH